MVSERIKTASLRVAAILAIAIGLNAVNFAEKYFSPAFTWSVPPAPWPVVYWVTLSYWLMAGMLFPVVLRLAAAFRFDSGPWRRNVAVHLVAAMCFSFLYLIGGRALSGDGWAGIPFVQDVMIQIKIYYVHGFVLYWGMLGAVFSYTYFQESRSRAINSLQLEASLAQANLQAIRSRLNPHFLFNTLGAISGLASVGDHEKVVELLGRLSQLLRRSFDDLVGEVPLRKELEFLNDYLEIQRVRFPNRLSFAATIAPDTLEALVPAMILQPLVENALEHGLGATQGKGCVELTAIRDAQFLHIEIRDTGPGFARSRHRSGSREGIGLDDTRTRLKYLYGAEHQFVCEDLPVRGARVALTIPFREPSTEQVAAVAV